MVKCSPQRVDTTPVFVRAQSYGDPVAGSWTFTAPLNQSRYSHTATLLTNGSVLITGGWGSNGAVVLSTAELFDGGLGYNLSSRPRRIDTVNSPIGSGDSLSITGSGFNDLINSAAPVVQLRSLEGSQTVLLSVANWSANALTTASVSGFPPGYALVTVSANGFSSSAKLITVKVPVPVVPQLTGIQSDGTNITFVFTNNPDTLFAILATTNLTLPLSNWTPVGSAIETSPGQFQFSGAITPDKPQQFYITRSP